MAAFTSAGRGRVFISYRREDSAFPAGWLYDRLCAHLGSDNVFKDVDSIDPGDDFARVIEDAVGSCQVLLALIGDRWLDITDGTGHRRLDDPEDFVRLEIEAALRRDVRVIPILVGLAPLPGSAQLPDSLRGLIRRQAIELSPNRFEPDVARLVRTIDKTLAAIVEGRANAPAPVDRTSRWPGPAATDGPETPTQGRGNLLADPHWADALSAFFAERWFEAVQRFEALLASYPGESRVETRLIEARRQRDIDACSSKAEAAVADGDWDTVVTALENLTGLDPNYPDVAARLEQARIDQRRKALVDEMTALHQAGRWEAVVAAAQGLVRLDPDNPDPGGIVSDAKAKICEAKLADRYAQALNHLDQEDWPQAVDLFAAIEREQPGYRDAAALLTTAQQQHDLAAWSDQAAAAGHDDRDNVVPALEKICAVDPTYQVEAERPRVEASPAEAGRPREVADTKPRRADAPEAEPRPFKPLVERLSRRSKILVGALTVLITTMALFTVVAVIGHYNANRSPTAVSAAQLDGLLLDTATVDNAMHTSGMTVTSRSDGMWDTSSQLADRNDLAVLGPAESVVYSGSGWTAMRGQVLDNSANENQIMQAVVAFPSANDAIAFYTASSRSWSASSNRQIDVKSSNEPNMTVSVGPISDQNSMLTVSATQPWTTWVLQRALTVRNNVVVDISASGLSPSPQLAADIAERIAAKVPG